MNDLESVLRLLNLQFDNIEFHRDDNVDKVDVQPQISFNIQVSAYNDERYRVSIKCGFVKESVYRIDIELHGDFELINNNVDEKLKKALLSQNTVSIMMPYIRSEISLITAQPGMCPVVIPPLNIQTIVNDENEKIGG